MSDTNFRQDQYFAWLASQVSPAQLSELYIVYADIESFCLKRKIMGKGLFELANLSDIRKVVDTVASNKIFRFTHKKSLSKMSFAMHFYYRFLKEHPELLTQEEQPKPETAEMNPVELVSEPVKQEKSIETTIEKRSTNKIDFLNIQSLAYTQPSEFSYFGEDQAKVNSWTTVYVRITKCLLEDYPDILLSYINHNIGGKGRFDFADEAGVDSMTAPRKVQESFYLETNISATDIVRKIKKLLDLCNVDYENVEIYYQKHDNSASYTTAMQHAESDVRLSEVEENRERFIGWMQQTGFAVGTIRSYVSAIGQTSNAANEHGVCDVDLMLIEDASRLQQILNVLLDTAGFRELNAGQHNRFRAAVSKLIDYRRGNQSATGHTQPEVKLQEPGISISEETRIHYAEILAEHFSEDGYQAGRAIFRGRFKRYYAEKFGYDPDGPDERIDEIMSMVGTKRDGRIFPNQNESQNDLITEIMSNILSAFDIGVSAVYIEAVFDKYQQSLADSLQIYNPDALASLLMAQANGKFTRKHSYLTNNRSGVNSQDDLVRIMKAFHQPQTYAAIHDKAWFLPYGKMKSILVSTASIVNVAAETYFYAPNLPVSADELAHLSSVIRDELSCHSHITDVRLMQLIEEKCSSIAINTDGYTTYGLRNCFGYIFRDQFSFTGPIIALRGNELRMSDVYAEFAKDHEVLQVDELSELSAEMNIGIYWDSVLDEMIRVSATELVRKGLIKFDVDAIDEILDGMCPGEYMPLPEANLFLQFPNVGYPWNSYLLESYLYSCSRRFRLLHSSFIKTGVYGAMVRKDAVIQDYRSLLVDVLSKSNTLGSVKSALQYIVDKGYQQRRRYEGIEKLIQEAKLIKEQRENKEK